MVSIVGFCPSDSTFGSTLVFSLFFSSRDKLSERSELLFWLSFLLTVLSRLETALIYSLDRSREESLMLPLGLDVELVCGFFT